MCLIDGERRTRDSKWLIGISLASSEHSLVDPGIADLTEGYDVLTTTHSSTGLRPDIREK
jgi:hypothetical protein